MICPVCKSSSNKNIYSNSSQYSISSLARKIEGKTEVFACLDCSHVYTKPLDKLEEYYDQQYNILVESEEEDQLFVTKEGKEFYRLEYQADIVEKKLDIQKGGRVLDYGCAKASTLKILNDRHQDVIPMCFDVSDSYQNFWDKFISSDHSFANIQLPSEWNGQIPFITSFFALEHAENPNEFMRDIHRLLTPEGQCVILVPDFNNNWADLIVADHVNHFTRESLHLLLSKNGFNSIDIDSDIYHGVFVVTAQKSITSEDSKKPHYVDQSIEKTIEIADYWKDFVNKITAIQDQISSDKFNIYGSGFYGAYITTLMTTDPENYIDQSPHRQGRDFFGKSIVAPENAPRDVKHMIVALNPKIAKQAIESNNQLSLEGVNIYYIL